MLSVVLCEILLCRTLPIPVPTLQILHEKIHDIVVERLKKAYAQVKIGDPLEGNHTSTVRQSLIS